MNGKNTPNQAINVIKDLRDGNGFPHYYLKFVKDGALLTEKNHEKLYIYKGYMEKLITEKINLYPILKDFDKNLSPAKLKRIKKALGEIKWHLLQPKIVDDQISKGDYYGHFYFETPESKIPKIKNLKRENMKETAVDERGNIIGYLYEETVIKPNIDDNSGIYTDSSRTVKWNFRRGYTVVYDPEKPVRIIPNRKGLEDEFSIIHIPSYYDQEKGFSKIISTNYIDSCLELDKIFTNWDVINTLGGFPRIHILNGEIDKENSVLAPSGYILVKPSNADDASNLKLEVVEVTNSLESIIKQMEVIEDGLFRMAFLIRPSLEKELGKSDSSRVVSQLRLNAENEGRLFLTNIAEGMKPWFKAVLGANADITFQVPDQVIQNSIFDDRLIKATDLNLGLKTLRQMLIDSGMNEVEVDEHMKQVNLEFIEKNKDIMSEIPKEMTDEGNVKLDNNLK